MKKRITVISLILVIFVLVGGSVLYALPQTQETADNPSAQQIAPGTPVKERVVTTGDEFTKTYRGWVSRIEDIAKAANSSYSDWVAGKIDRETLNSSIEKLNTQMKVLNLETDLKTEFTLSPEDQKMAGYGPVTKEYAQASKFLNNFLYNFPHYSDTQLKDQFGQYTENYSNHLQALKKELKME